jgi:hypothetical protein
VRCSLNSGGPGHTNSRLSEGTRLVTDLRWWHLSRLDSNARSSFKMVAHKTISRHSRFFENLLEHRFLYDLCRCLVLREQPVIANVMRSEVDAFGFDLVIAADERTVHIQMKTRSGTVEPNPYEISEALWKLPKAVVVWMLYSASTLEPLNYYIFGCPIPRMEDYAVAKRAGFRNVTMRRATHKAISIEQVAQLLFPDNALQVAPSDITHST